MTCRSIAKWNIRLVVFAVMTGGLVAVALLTGENSWLVRVFHPLDLLAARATAATLRWCGMTVQREAAILAHPGGFSYEIYYACTGLVPAAILALAILAFPARLQQKLTGIFIGVPLLFLVNLIRLASLFFIGVRYPAAFPLVHRVVWNGLLAVVVVLLFMGWLQWRRAMHWLEGSLWGYAVER